MSEWVKLEGGAEVFIDTPRRKGICKACKKEFVWGVTRKNRFKPVIQREDGSWISHFVDCPNADQFRRKK